MPNVSNQNDPHKISWVFVAFNTSLNYEKSNSQSWYCICGILALEGQLRRIMDYKFQASVGYIASLWEERRERERWLTKYVLNIKQDGE